MSPENDEKQALLDSIAEILGIRRDALGPGSKEHKAFLRDVATAINVPLAKHETKLSLAEKLVTHFGETWAPIHYSTGSSIQTNAFRVIRDGLIRRYGESHNAFMKEVLRQVSAMDPGQPPPEGNKTPARFAGVGSDFQRSKAVAAWILFHAKGLCEHCQRKAPFTTDLGQQYLEVHHVVTLANGGPDTVDNTVALCPNCHRAAHLSRSREDIKNYLQMRVRTRAY